MATDRSSSAGSSQGSWLGRVLLNCGVVSSLLYVGADVFASTRWQGYSYVDQAFSELTAIEAPTRPLMVASGLIWGVLVIAFGVGVWKSSGRSRVLRLSGASLILNAVAGAGGGVLFPMHSRGAGGLTSDSMHIVFTMAEVIFLLLAIGLGGTTQGKWFRLYSILTIVVLLLFGAWAGMDAPQVAAGLGTPWMGVKERTNIYASMLWVLVYAIALLRAQKEQKSSNMQ